LTDVAVPKTSAIALHANCCGTSLISRSRPRHGTRHPDVKRRPSRYAISDRVEHSCGQVVEDERRTSIEAVVGAISQGSRRDNSVLEAATSGTSIGGRVLSSPIAKRKEIGPSRRAGRTTHDRAHLRSGVVSGAASATSPRASAVSDIGNTAIQRTSVCHEPSSRSRWSRSGITHTAGDDGCNMPPERMPRADVARGSCKLM